MPQNRDSQHRARSIRRRATSAAVWSVAFVAFMVFGVILLIGADWIPGAIITAAGLVCLAVTVSVIGKLCREGPAASPPWSKPVS